MTAASLLDRLDGVRKTGADTWRARCPAHGSRSLTLAVREADDGRVLLHCHAGCGVDAIVGAVGLDLGDLFPARPVEHGRPIRRPFPAADLLAACAEDAVMVCLLAGDVAAGRPLTDQARRSLLAAAARIDAARRLADGR